jgi:catechol 2,3-dioxygenase-like lactoylglutathione lyase family enzyme
MQRSTTFALTIGAVAAFLLSRPALEAQAPDAGAVIGTGTFTAFVENMDRSLAFFHDVFDMEVPPLPVGGGRPYNNPNPRLFAMFAIPGARERHQSARVPAARVNVELMEIQNIEFKTIPLRVQDPGSATLVLIVRDVDAALARARQAGAKVANPSGQPVSVADGRAALIRDVDDRLIELRQPAMLPEAAAAVAANVVDMRLSIAVDDMDRTTHVYRDVLGFRVEGETPLAEDKNLQALTGLSKARVRRSRVQAPGSMLWIEFVEYKGVERTPLHFRIQDRGAARLQLRAQNVDALVATMKAAGLTVVSDGGAAVPIPPNLKGALVADPNNFFLTPFAPCDGCAPTRPAPVNP